MTKGERAFCAPSPAHWRTRHDKTQLDDIAATLDAFADGLERFLGIVLSAVPRAVDGFNRAKSTPVLVVSAIFLCMLVAMFVLFFSCTLKVWPCRPSQPREQAAMMKNAADRVANFQHGGHVESSYDGQLFKYTETPFAEPKNKTIVECPPAATCACAQAPVFFSHLDATTKYRHGLRKLEQQTRTHAAVSDNTANFVRQQVDLDNNGNISAFELGCGYAKLVRREMWHERLLDDLRSA